MSQIGLTRKRCCSSDIVSVTPKRTRHDEEDESEVTEDLGNLVKDSCSDSSSLTLYENCTPVIGICSNELRVSQVDGASDEIDAGAPLNHTRRMPAPAQARFPTYMPGFIPGNRITVGPNFGSLSSLSQPQSDGVSNGLGLSNQDIFSLRMRTVKPGSFSVENTGQMPLTVRGYHHVPNSNMVAASSVVMQPFGISGQPFTLNNSISFPRASVHNFQQQQQPKDWFTSEKPRSALPESFVPQLGIGNNLILQNNLKLEQRSSNLSNNRTGDTNLANNVFISGKEYSRDSSGMNSNVLANSTELSVRELLQVGRISALNNSFSDSLYNTGITTMQLAQIRNSYLGVSAQIPSAAVSSHSMSSSANCYTVQNILSNSSAVHCSSSSIAMSSMCNNVPGLSYNGMFKDAARHGSSQLILNRPAGPNADESHQFSRSVNNTAELESYKMNRIVKNDVNSSNSNSSIGYRLISSECNDNVTFNAERFNINSLNRPTILLPGQLPTNNVRFSHSNTNYAVSLGNIMPSSAAHNASVSSVGVGFAAQTRLPVNPADNYSRNQHQDVRATSSGLSLSAGLAGNSSSVGENKQLYGPPELQLRFSSNQLGVSDLSALAPVLGSKPSAARPSDSHVTSHLLYQPNHSAAPTDADVSDRRRVNVGCDERERMLSEQITYFEQLVNGQKKIKKSLANKAKAAARSNEEPSAHDAQMLEEASAKQSQLQKTLNQLRKDLQRHRANISSGSLLAGGAATSGSNSSLQLDDSERMSANMQLMQQQLSAQSSSEKLFDNKAILSSNHERALGAQSACKPSSGSVPAEISRLASSEDIRQPVQIKSSLSCIGRDSMSPHFPAENIPFGSRPDRDSSSQQSQRRGSYEYKEPSANHLNTGQSEHRDINSSNNKAFNKQVMTSNEPSQQFSESVDKYVNNQTSIRSYADDRSVQGGQSVEEYHKQHFRSSFHQDGRSAIHLDKQSSESKSPRHLLSPSNEFQRHTVSDHRQAVPFSHTDNNTKSAVNMKYADQLSLSERSSQQNFLLAAISNKVMSKSSEISGHIRNDVPYEKSAELYHNMHAGGDGRMINRMSADCERRKEVQHNNEHKSNVMSHSSLDAMQYQRPMQGDTRTDQQSAEYLYQKQNAKQATTSSRGRGRQRGGGRPFHKDGLDRADHVTGDGIGVNNRVNGDNMDAKFLSHSNQMTGFNPMTSGSDLSTVAKSANGEGGRSRGRGNGRGGLKGRGALRAMAQQRSGVTVEMDNESKIRSILESMKSRTDGSIDESGFDKIVSIMGEMLQKIPGGKPVQPVLPAVCEVSITHPAFKTVNKRRVRGCYGQARFEGVYDSYYVTNTEKRESIILHSSQEQESSQEFSKYSDVSDAEGPVEDLVLLSQNKSSEAVSDAHTPDKDSNFISDGSSTEDAMSPEVVACRSSSVRAYLTSQNQEQLRECRISVDSGMATEVSADGHVMPCPDVDMKESDCNNEHQENENPLPASVEELLHNRTSIKGHSSESLVNSGNICDTQINGLSNKVFNLEAKDVKHDSNNKRIEDMKLNNESSGNNENKSSDSTSNCDVIYKPISNLASFSTHQKESDSVVVCKLSELCRRVLGKSDLSLMQGDATDPSRVREETLGDLIQSVVQKFHPADQNDQESVTAEVKPGDAVLDAQELLQVSPEQVKVSVILKRSKAKRIASILSSLSDLLKISVPSSYMINKHSLEDEDVEKASRQTLREEKMTVSSLVQSQPKFCMHCSAVIVNWELKGMSEVQQKIPFNFSSNYYWASIQPVFCSSSCQAQYDSCAQRVTAVDSSTGLTDKIKPLMSDILPHVADQQTNDRYLPKVNKFKNKRFRKWKATSAFAARAKKLFRKIHDSNLVVDADDLFHKLPVDDSLVDVRECVLCKAVGDGESHTVGRLINLDSDKWIHVNCALWSYDVYETMDGALVNVMHAYKHGVMEECEFCHLGGATVACNRARCVNQYHLPCALKAGSMFFSDKTVLCSEHCPSIPTDTTLSSLVVLRQMYVDRNENKQIARMLKDDDFECGIRCGALVLHCFGQLLPHQIQTGRFNSSQSVYPVGYKVTRYYWSYRRLNARCRYLCTVEDRGGRPEFVIKVQEEGFEDTEISAPTCAGVWMKILRPLEELRRKNNVVNMFSSYMSGEDLYGFHIPQIQRVLESMPGVELMHNITFQYGKSPMYILPLPVNPTGCIRTEPKTTVLLKRAPTLLTSCNVRPHSSKFSAGGSSAASSSDFSITQYMKQFTASKSQRYRSLKTEWRNNVYLRRSNVQGLGLFAARELEKHTMVIEYIGQLIRNEVSEFREKVYEQQNRGVYMFRIDDNTVIDATMAGGPARYINHSCSPNCFTEVVPTEKGDKIIIIAKRKIQSGEELTYDYKLDFEDETNKIPCLCGAPNCCKWMN